MGLFDKIKEQATEISSKVETGISQAQGKLDQVQLKRKRDGLLQQLGELALQEHRNQSPADAMTKINDLFAQIDELDANPQGTN
jgi:hypothetical protein